MITKKITIISFDNWNYDNFLVAALKKKGIEAHHIKIGGFKHNSLLSRLKNTCSKIFLNKNPKLKKRQEYIIETLAKLGFQDQILVINPDLITVNYHAKIKNFTNKYIAYLYDSVARYPTEHLLNGIFDEIYSFDAADSAKFGFKKSTNYVYLDKVNEVNFDTKYKVVTVSSFDKRFPLFNKIANQLAEKQINFKLIFISKNIWYKLYKYKQKHKDSINSEIKFQSNKIDLQQVNQLYKDSLIILDLVQGFQSGLSFRVFEAMALQKKIITDNKAIANYDFYDPNNILIVEENNLQLNDDFFNKPYQPIPENIYNKYTVNNWVETVFNL
jgi:hypothetical protein